MEPTPENLRRNCHRICLGSRSLACDECRDWKAAADRIEELEAALDPSNCTMEHGGSTIETVKPCPHCGGGVKLSVDFPELGCCLDTSGSHQRTTDMTSEWAEAIGAYVGLMVGVLKSLADDGASSGQSIVRLIASHLDDAGVVADFDMELVDEAWRAVGGSSENAPSEVQP